jgi:hypothetical protein
VPDGIPQDRKEKEKNAKGTAQYNTALEEG